MLNYEPTSGENYRQKKDRLEFPHRKLRKFRFDDPKVLQTRKVEYPHFSKSPLCRKKLYNSPKAGGESEIC